MKIKATIAEKQGAPIKVEDVILDEPKPNEILIKTVATGICHTDIAGRDLGMTPYPVALGHEGAGIVEKVGSTVKYIKPGDHVVVSFSYCGHCKNCLSGHPAKCIHLNELCFGGKNYDGSYRLHTVDGKDISTFFGQSSLATYIIADEHNVVKVDPEIDLKYLGSIGCGFQTGAGTILNEVKPEFASNIVITGAGGVGLAAVMAANLYNPDHLIVIDRHDDKLAMAKELGATDVINTANVDDVEGAIRSIVPEGLNYAVDSIGYSPLITDLLHALDTDGKLYLIGIAGKLDLTGMDIMGESKQIIGLIEGDAIPQLFIPKLVKYFKKGKFPIDKLMKFYSFNEIDKAFEDFTAGKVIKPVITFE
ncbi:NAD(P)-dependent alcohol dehydrogenase [Lactobacillus sp. 0.1XD8-4]|uniref:NAD(P)-dependent alcohol dehydrogenase n=1 Tax=uncultured Limosilactobacillus sp. TaxID=2837629 RepID=UPI00129D6349|nr:NAD(P)-dependent alcohol dehydrogenase [uncultured Limosilactobacillus sp.]MRN06116.1 NAD(P)-dependent alcohol dehydrogenase [Lactobacillus sp. 0.1XD8-4]